MVMMIDPMKIVFLRPSVSPTKIVNTAPQKHPRLYEATAMPWYVDRVADESDETAVSEVSIDGKYLTKLGRSRRPPVTP